MKLYNNNNKIIFKKITSVICGNKLKSLTKKYNTDYRAQHFYTESHILSMIYLQLSGTQSLNGLVDKIKHSPKLQSMINSASLSQISRKNASRDYRVFEDVFYEVLNIAKRKLGITVLNKHFKEIKAIDSTIIQIASTLAPKLNYENGKSGLKISTLLNISSKLPEKVEIVPARTNDRKCINGFISDKNALYLFDKGYYDYSWYDNLSDNGYKFITRQTSNAVTEEISSTYVDNDLVFDYEVTMGTDYSSNKTKNTYREILTFDENEEEVRILTNIFDIPAEEILLLYKLRWKIELFFKWIKQNLKIKKWLGYNENAVKIQIYSALIAYVLLMLFKLLIKSKLSILQFTRVIEINLLEEVEIMRLLDG